MYCLQFHFPSGDVKFILVRHMFQLMKQVDVYSCLMNLRRLICDVRPMISEHRWASWWTPRNPAASSLRDVLLFLPISFYPPVLSIFWFSIIDFVRSSGDEQLQVNSLLGVESKMTKEHLSIWRIKVNEGYDGLYFLWELHYMCLNYLILNFL